MDLIAIFPRVRHTKRCLPSGESCREPVCNPDSLYTHETVRRLNPTHEENQLMKQFDAAWLAGFRAARQASKASCFSKESRHDPMIQSSGRKAQQQSVPTPVMAENSRRYVKDLESTAKTKKRPVKARGDVDKSRKNIRLAALYLPSLTLWFLSFIAAVIWLGVFFVERQPTAHEEVYGIGTVRFAETPVSSYGQEKSRQ